MIMNRHGHLVWHRGDFGNTCNLMVQRYRDEDVLTFWHGDDQIIGHGAGFYYIVCNLRAYLRTEKTFIL